MGGLDRAKLRDFDQTGLTPGGDGVYICIQLGGHLFQNEFEVVRIRSQITSVVNEQECRLGVDESDGRTAAAGGGGRTPAILRNHLSEF